MLEFYEEAARYDVAVFTGHIPAAKSISIPGAICLDSSLAFTGAPEKVSAYHELGHCVRGAFYTKDDPDYLIRRCENKANKWAIRRLIPREDLEAAVADGYTEPWELAEIFDVTVEFMKLAMWYYANGNLAMPPEPATTNA